MSELLARYSEAVMPTFKTPARVFARGEGVYLWDTDGNRYTDLLSGIAVNSLGHAHPRVLETLASQAATLGHISNLFASEPQIRLAERLAAYAGGGKVFFCNSGSEANEAAFKLTRLTGRTHIVATEGSFHGRTTGALAITGTPAYRQPFEPLAGDITFVSHGDERALHEAVTDQTAAVVIEPIQGENGVRTAPEGYLRAAREITAEHGALLWIDEVQTGIGRCGEVLYHRSHGIQADLITVAKGLSAGFPAGACIATGRAASLFTPGSHGTTFGGNPLATAVGNTVLDVLEEGLLDQVRATSQWLVSQLQAIAAPISEVRGAGLLLGVVLEDEVAPQVVSAALADGWIINAPRPDVVRLAPPLIITPEQLAPFVDALPGWLHHA